MNKTQPSSRRMEIAKELLIYQAGNYPILFERIRILWFEYFGITMKELGVKDELTIKLLFRNLKLKDWITPETLKKLTRDLCYFFFVSYCMYYTLRISFDRLFICHHFFKRIFLKEILEYWKEREFFNNDIRKV